jgi:hypothetical protein
MPVMAVWRLGSQGAPARRGNIFLDDDSMLYLGWERRNQPGLRHQIASQNTITIAVTTQRLT